MENLKNWEQYNESRTYPFSEKLLNYIENDDIGKIDKHWDNVYSFNFKDIDTISLWKISYYGIGYRYNAYLGKSPYGDGGIYNVSDDTPITLSKKLGKKIYNLLEKLYKTQQHDERIKNIGKGKEGYQYIEKLKELLKSKNYKGEIVKESDKKATSYIYKDTIIKKIIKRNGDIQYKLYIKDEEIESSHIQLMGLFELLKSEYDKNQKIKKSGLLKKYSIDIDKENNKKHTLKYSCFDWDDNILFMPTKIHMEELVDNKWTKKDISTEKFAEIRSLDNWKSNDDSFIEFRDHGKRGSDAFLDDVKKAIKEKTFGPSWDDFIKCIRNGNIFAIITARGHESESIRKGVEYIINNVMNDDDKNELISNLIAFNMLFFDKDEYNYDNSYEYYKNIKTKDMIKLYLDKCYFIGVSSPNFVQNHGGDASNPEKGKVIAMDNFVNKINEYSKILDLEAKIGFSDDDKHNVKKIKKFFNEISTNYDQIMFDVFDTSNKKIQKFENYKNIG